MDLMDLMDLDGPEYASGNASRSFEDDLNALIKSFDILTVHDDRRSIAPGSRRLTDRDIVVAAGIKKRVAHKVRPGLQRKVDLKRLFERVKTPTANITLEPRYASPLTYCQRFKLWQRIRRTTMIEAPTTFHFFSLLPPELRTRIWELARPEARIVKVEWSKKGTPFSACTIPGLLHACFESRIIALKWYNLAFSQPWDSTINEKAPEKSKSVKDHALGVTPGQNITKRVFFDATRDWVFHDCGCSSVWCDNCDGLYGFHRERDKITRVILTCDRDLQTIPFYPFTLHFTQAEELLLLDPGESIITPNSKMAGLKLSSTTFSFQTKPWRPFMSLQELLEDERECVMDLFSNLGCLRPWHLKRVASVETKQLKSTLPIDFCRDYKVM